MCTLSANEIYKNKGKLMWRFEFIHFYIVILIGKRCVFLCEADLNQQARKPPSTGRVIPFVILLLSLRRNKIVLTTSSTSACRHTHTHAHLRVSVQVHTSTSNWEFCNFWPAKLPRGMRDVMVLDFSGSLQAKRPISVITTVGFTLFTRIWPEHTTNALIQDWLLLALGS